jgi:hypothetical protein
MLEQLPSFFISFMVIYLLICLSSSLSSFTMLDYSSCIFYISGAMNFSMNFIWNCWLEGDWSPSGPFLITLLRILLKSELPSSCYDLLFFSELFLMRLFSIVPSLDLFLVNSAEVVELRYFIF